MKLLQKRKEDMERIKEDKANIVYQLHMNKERIINHIEDLESKIKGIVRNSKISAFPTKFVMTP